ncbi:hypothetical protein J3R80_08270 [Aliiroseovarius sp. Z3]|uniref:hypothetical protein n=1 Tax=Aliiroseovarius sp. Z3 TaxID=2811402 RepID=UPI0023B23DD0|nr:hypothetical protein [Aliiroseovarius sp. Z3]MDE9450461.1 hypothetical protein [Aliiroseovarius sp. Z3]
MSINRDFVLFRRRRAGGFAAEMFDLVGITATTQIQVAHKKQTPPTRVRRDIAFN